MRFKKSLQTKLVIYLVSLSLISIAAVAIFSYHISKKTLIKTINITLEHLVQGRANKIDAFLASVSRIPVVLAGAVEADKTKDESLLKERIYRVLFANPDVYGSAVVYKPFSFYSDQKSFMSYWWNNNGKLDYIEQVPEDYLYWEYDWYIVPRDSGEKFWSQPYFDKGAGDALMVTSSAPFYDADKKFLGVATVNISLDHLSALLKDVVKSAALCGVGHSILVNEEGMVLGVDDPSFIVESTEEFLTSNFYNIEDGKFKIIAEEAYKKKRGITDAINLRNYEKVFAAYTVLESTGWTLIIFVPTDFMLQCLTDMSQGILWLTLLIIIILLVLVGVVARAFDVMSRRLCVRVNCDSVRLLITRMMLL